MKTINYSIVTLNELEEVFDIDAQIDRKPFDEWFLQEYELNQDELNFTEHLIQRNRRDITNYTELELVSKVIAPILNFVDFKLEDKKIRDWYEAPLKVEYKDIVFNGRCDFVVAKGYDSPINPYFFIQEFKQASASFPESQLLAELIVSTIINKTNVIKGAYIIGAVWVFVILEKIDDNKYRYYTSKNLDSMDIDDLRQIYKNLQIVKKEIDESC
jgi:hypothetical protein